MHSHYLSVLNVWRHEFSRRKKGHETSVVLPLSSWKKWRKRDLSFEGNARHEQARVTWVSLKFVWNKWISNESFTSSPGENVYFLGNKRVRSQQSINDVTRRRNSVSKYLRSLLLVVVDLINKARGRKNWRERVETTSWFVSSHDDAHIWLDLSGILELWLLEGRKWSEKDFSVASCDRATG